MSCDIVQLGPKSNAIHSSEGTLSFLARLIPGSFAAAYFVLISNYMWIKDMIYPKGMDI